MNLKVKNIPKSKKDTFYGIILDRIIKCEYNSKDIITEKGLVEEFGVSKSPIREALLELSNEGYLKSIPRFGYQISTFNKDIIEEITEFRICLEYSTLDRLWDRKNIDDILDLEEYIKKNYKPSYKKKDVLNYWQFNTEFHVRLISLFNNNYSTERLKRAMKYLGVAYSQSYWRYYHENDIVSDCNCHMAIIEALKKNDKPAALENLYTDINNFAVLDK